MSNDDVAVHSVSAGLDYPGVGPEHAMFREVGRCEYRGITDDETLDAFRELSESERIIPALETSHSLALAKQLAEEGDHDSILVNLSGRGTRTWRLPPSASTSDRGTFCPSLAEKRV